MAASNLRELIGQASPRYSKGQKEEEERSIEPVSFSPHRTGRPSDGES
jgi:hypothetical protein